MATRTTPAALMVRFERHDHAIEQIIALLELGRFDEALDLAMLRSEELAACWGEGKGLTQTHYIGEFRRLEDAAFNGRTF